jgi:DNA-binding protein HU-beta
MNKSDLVAKIAEQAGITKAVAEKALAAFTGTVETAIKAGDKVTLIGFGTFSAVTRKARIGRNPATGKEIKIAAKTSGKFSPGSALKDLGAKKAKPAATKKAAPAKAKAPAPKEKAKK